MVTKDVGHGGLAYLVVGLEQTGFGIIVDCFARDSGNSITIVFMTRISLYHVRNALKTGLRFANTALGGAWVAASRSGDGRSGRMATLCLWLYHVHDQLIHFTEIRVSGDHRESPA